MAERKRKKADSDGGAPTWLATYGDLMSLLLTFFVLLAAFSTISEKDFKEGMESIQTALNLLNVFQLSPSGPMSGMRQRRDQNTDRAARNLRRRLQIIGREKQVKIEMDAMGGIKVSLPNIVLFDEGSATLREDALPLLDDIGVLLREIPETFVEVRGHTDESPVLTGSNFRDNYDLSYFRADAVARRLSQASSVPMRQMEIVACGDGQPIAPNDTEEGRVANRRVEVYVRGLIDRSKIRQLEKGLRTLENKAASPEPMLAPNDL
jgi:chemotaxis protein MotB